MASRKATRVAIAVLVLSVVGALGAAGGWYWWTVGRYHETTDDAYVQGEITPISPKVAGYVRALAVEDNQPVQAGDVLLRIDDREFRLAVDEAEARVAETKAALANVEARMTLQSAMIEQAEAGVAAAEAEAERAAKELARAKNLLKNNVGTRRRYDDAVAARRKAEAGLKRARAQLREARQEVRVLESERKRLKAVLARSEAALALAKTRLADTVITAPVSGVIGNRAVRLGQYVRPGALLMAVVPLGKVWIEANYKETQLAQMRVGQPAEIAVDAFPGVRLRGRIESFSPASGAEFSLLPPENATGNFTKIVQRIPVKIALDADNPLAGRLRPGMSVEVTVNTRRPAHAGAQAREAR